MSKSAKRKRKKSRNKQQHHGTVQPKLQIDPADLQQLQAEPVNGADGDMATEGQSAIMPEKQAEAETEVLTKSAAVQDLRAALQAKQQQQPRGWKQQVKAGKMVGAHVPKRFNRGG